MKSTTATTEKARFQFPLTISYEIKLRKLYSPRTEEAGNSNELGDILEKLSKLRIRKLSIIDATGKSRW